ncbi:MAG TPA: hypothetical protein DDY78_04580 [Planctomycetales bacterium]|jgi:hypothetical protein|nr:hypothetical protein [Planctomycetales bacterium]
MLFRLSRASTRRPVPFFLLALGAGLVAVLPALAQQPLPDSTFPSPRLLSVSPTGAKAGTVVAVTFAGTDLDEPEKILFSIPGFKADLVPPPPPDPKAPKPQPNAPKPPVVYKVIVPLDAPLGVADVRIAGKWGVSNARAFVVGDLPEVLEKEPNNDLPESQRVELNTTINGTMASAVDVDYYAFAGKKGQRVLVSCLASTIDSRFLPGVELYDSKNHLLATGRNYLVNDALADCTLPDDGDYTIRLFEFTHTANFPPGPNEYFYRLTITTAPWIDAIFPAVFEPGKPTMATIYGRNLPGGQLDPTAVVDGRVLEKLATTITAPADPAAANRLTYSGRLSPSASGLDGFEYRVKNAVGASNPFLLTLARNPVVLHNDANNTLATVQEVTPPCEIAGRFGKVHDRDWYVFTAKKGDVYNLEILSDRLGAPTLTFLVVHDAAQKLVYESPDDNKDSFSNKFFTHSEDPAPYRFTAPADGKYFVQVGGHLADTMAGPRHFYRLRIGPDQPDFRLVVTAGANARPDACTLWQGGNQSYTVFAWRRDGFVGDIQLSVEGLPAGVTCPPQTIGGGVRETQLVLNAGAGAAAWTGEIKIKGTATIKGQPVVREARAGGVVWPSPQPTQTMPLAGRVERTVALAVRADKAPWAVTTAMTTAIDNAILTQSDPKKLTTATITVKLTRAWPDLNQPIAVQALAPELPGQQNQQGSQLTINNNQPINLAPGQAEAKLPVAVGANVQPGVYNVVLRTSAANVPYVRDPKATPKPAAVNIVLVEPAAPLTITVLPRVVGTLTLATPNPTLKAGGEVAVVVKVARLYDYAGEFKVSLVPPAAVKDVTAAEVVIPAGKDEATLVLKAPPTAAPGGRNDLVVHAVALFNGSAPTTQEVKFNLNVVK